MEDKAVQAVRAKRDSSMRVALRLVRDRRAAGFMTAGNTGAAMATAKMVLGAIPGVDRPALAAIFPTAIGTVASLAWMSARTWIASRTTLNNLQSWERFIFAPCLERGVRGWACFPLARKRPRATS